MNEDEDVDVAGVMPRLRSATSKGDSLSDEYEGPELPEELAEILQQLTRRSFNSGLAHDPLADEVLPSKEQLDVVPGDTVAVMSTQSEQEREFMIAKVVNPEDHAETYPDWESRIRGEGGGLHSFVLATWFSPENQEGILGWFPRAKLIKVPEENWDEMYQWIQTGKPAQEPPAWLIVRYNEALALLAEANPEMPEPIRCPECNSTGVTVSLYREESRKLSYCMGIPADRRGQPWSRLEVISPYEEKRDGKVWAELHCYGCGYHDPHLPDELELFG